MSEYSKITPAESAADSKARGETSYVAWDRYIQNTGLKPDVDAKEFYKIYQAVSASDSKRYDLPNDWTATHIDTLVGRAVQIKHENGVYYMIWNNGIKGSDPDEFHSTERYEAINA